MKGFLKYQGRYDQKSYNRKVNTSRTHTNWDFEKQNDILKNVYFFQHKPAQFSNTT